MVAGTWVILFLFVIISYWYCRKNFAAPWFLLCLSIWASFSIVVLNIINWDIKNKGYNGKTTVCFLAVLISFFIGSFIGKLILQRKSKDILKTLSYNMTERSKRNYPYNIFAILSIILLIFYFIFNLTAIDFHSLSSFEKSLRTLYDTKKQGNFLRTQIFEIIIAIAYINLHRYMVEKYLLLQKPNKKIIIPIIVFLIYSLFSTDRNTLLRYIIFGLAIFVMSYNWENITNKKNFKLIINVGLLIIVSAIVFWGYGRLKNYTSNFERAVGIYAGSGLYGFNLWLNDFNNQFTNGNYTFSSIQRTLYAFGIGSGTNVARHLELISYASPNGYVFATNIYSALRTYYQDFGIIGLIIFPFLTGFTYEILYQISINKKFGFWWLFYVAHIYPIVYYPIAEQFFLRFHLGLVYEIFWLCFFYYLVYSKNGLWHIKMSCTRNIKLKK